MKVTFLGTLPPIIGLSPYCMHLSYALSKKIDLDFIGFKKFSQMSKSFSRETEINEQIYHNILKNIKTKKTLNWYNPISGLIAGIRLKTDILHVQWWISSLFFVYFPIIIMAKLKNIRIVASVHNIFPHEKSKKNIILDRIANFFIFPLTDAFIVHNQRNKKQFIKLYNIEREKIFIITHGVLDFIKKRNILQNDAKKYLQISTKKKIILFFGYIRPYKGVDVLINAFSIIKKQMDDVMLLIVGQIWNDNWNNYEKLIKKHGLEDIIDIKSGFIPESEIDYYFSAADVVVLPYKHLDTHGGVGAIAICYKKPLLVTDVGGLPEYIKDKRALVIPNDIQDLSNKLINILQNNQLQLKLSKDSEELSKYLTWDKIADKTIEIYRTLL